MTTAVAVLQEVLTAINATARFSCVAATGPLHISQFVYRCVACDIEVTAVGSSKKKAKEAAAKTMLGVLAERGIDVPPPYGLPEQVTPDVPVIEISASDDVNEELLKEYCTISKLGEPKYELIDDAGASYGDRRFEVKVTVGEHERRGLAATEHDARQRAAKLLHDYLKESRDQIEEGEA